MANSTKHYTTLIVTWYLAVQKPLNVSSHCGIAPAPISDCSQYGV